MARSTDINQRIVLTGDDEVRRKLDALGAAGTRAFDRAGGSSKNLGFAVRNLSFQVNDLVTSFASGGNAMQIFAQQGGQIAQAFQQGGGLGPVLGGVASSVRSMITPMRVAGGLVVGLAAGFAALVARASDAESRTRELGVILKGLGQAGLPQILRPGDQSQISRGIDKTAKELEQAARRLRDVGLSADEATQKFAAALRLGIPSGRLEEITRIGENLKAVLGDIDFAKVIKGGVEPLREIAKQLKITGQNTTAAQDGLTTIDALIRAIGEKVKGLNRESLSPFSQAARDAKIAWQEFLDTLTPVGTFGLRGFDNLLKTATALANLDFAGVAQGFAAAFEPLQTFFTVTLPSFATTALTTIRTQLASADPLGLTALATAAAGNMQQLFQTVGDTIIQTLTASFASANPFAPLVSYAQAAVNTITSWLKSLADYAAGIARTIASLGAASVPEFTAPIPPAFVPDLSGSGGFAAGGLVRGPGSGTSDSIWTRISNGEFVMNAAATRQNLPLLHALNSLNTSLIPRRRGFAGGGLVGAAAAAGGSPVYLQIPGGSSVGPMMADREVVAAIGREAQRGKLLSAGRRPSHIGGRRYGG